MANLTLLAYFQSSHSILYFGNKAVAFCSSAIKLLGPLEYRSNVVRDSIVFTSFSGNAPPQACAPRGRQGDLNKMYRMVGRHGGGGRLHKYRK